MWKLPLEKDKAHSTWRRDWLGEIKKTKDLDQSFWGVDRKRPWVHMWEAFCSWRYWNLKYSFLLLVRFAFLFTLRLRTVYSLVSISCVVRVGTFRWPPVHGLPHMDYQIDYPNGLSNGLPRWTTHMDYLIKYPRKRKERNITPSGVIRFDWIPRFAILLFSFCVYYRCSDGCRRKKGLILRFVAFVHLPFSFRSRDVFVASLLIMKSTSYCVVRRN